MTDIMEEIKKMQLDFSKGMIELKESQKETDRQIKESQIELKESQKETDRQMKEIQKELGGIGNSQEEVGIDLFRRNMKGILRRRGINIDDTTTKFKNKIRLEDNTFVEGEYDLMGINGKEIVVVEVKNKLKNDDIIKFLEKQLPNFKILFPQYKDFNLYGGVGSLIVGKDQEELAEDKGLFVFTQGEDGNAMIMNKDDFKAKVF